jgi:pimeloyl-ACP methyl ester carboxylesterase
MRPFRAIVATFLLTGLAAAQERVSFPTGDGGSVHADLYGEGDRGVVLAHGGRFNKESWKAQAEALEKAGFRVVGWQPLRSGLTYPQLSHIKCPVDQQLYLSPVCVTRGRGAVEILRP